MSFKKTLATLLVGGVLALNGKAYAKQPISLKGNLSNQSKIAFVSTRDGNEEIYTINPDGTGLTNITNTSAKEKRPSWSPDGKRIAFQSDRDGSCEIYVMNADGSNVKRLTNNAAVDDMPVWSPDGKKIAYVVKENRSREIYVMNADGSNVKRLTNNAAVDDMPVWSPDGKNIAYVVEDFIIHVMKADGSKSAKLSKGARPSWSPDGKKIAFISSDQFPQIYIMDADGDNIERLVKTPSASDFSKLTHQEQLALMLPNILPVWSPDGKRILFTRVVVDDLKDPVKGGMNYEVFTMNTEGGDQRRLTVAAGIDMGLGWWPDSKKIVFTSDRDGNKEIYIINVDGSEPINLTNDPATDASPVWSP